MSVEKAKAHYLGKPGHQKLNCAQTIAHAFRRKYDLGDDVIMRLGVCGGGRAPDGQCGSLYAAKLILEKEAPHRLADCEKALLERAGSVRCREIRKLNRLSCAGCVEKVAEFVDNIVLSA